MEAEQMRELAESAKPVESAYEEFKKKVADILRGESQGLTWTEIKEKAGFTQKVPNNRWVRQMEKDIGLTRSKEARGIVWRLK